MRILAIIIDYDASSQINIITPLAYLAARGDLELTVRREFEVAPGDVASADVLVACRTVDPTYKPIFQLAHDLGIPIIYDLDDNLFEIPRSSAVLYSYFAHPARLAQHEWMLRTAARIRVHSPVLRNIVGRFNDQINVVWAAVDWSLLPPKLPVIRTDPLEIVYAASTYTGEMLFPIIQSDVMRLLERHSGRVRLHFLGYNPPALAGHPGVVFEPFQSDFKAFMAAFTRQGYAIGLAPMLDDRFFQCKTDLKFRDYAAAGAAGVYSDSALYRNSVVHGESGLLVKNEPGAWYEVLVRLSEDREQIERLRESAYTAAKARYTPEIVGQMWLNDLHAVQRRPTTIDVTSVQQMRWWFNRPLRPETIPLRHLRRLYLKVVPFRVHVHLSNVYHALKRRVAEIRRR